MSDMDKMTTGNLINAEKVHGTTVYNAQGEKLGSIEDLVLDKIEGRVQYAILSFGGFLGMGDKHHPLPWSVLTYNPSLGGYEVAVTDEQLKGAPKYRSTEEWDDGNRDRDTLIYGYYGVPPYWM